MLAAYLNGSTVSVTDNNGFVPDRPRLRIAVNIRLAISAEGDVIPLPLPAVRTFYPARVSDGTQIALAATGTRHVICHI